MTVVHMNQIRIEQALRLAKQIQLKSGHDAEAFSALRKIFCEEQLQRGTRETSSTTLARIPAGNSAQDWVRAAQRQAGSVFENAGRLLVAVACPVTVCIKGPAHALAPINQGDVVGLGFLAERTRDVMCCGKVVFGHEMFTLQDLMQKTSRQTLAHCRKLLDYGSGLSAGEGMCTSAPWYLRSSPSARWELVFFLGVCELDLHQSLKLEIAIEAERLRHFSVHGKYAILSSPAVMFNRNLSADGCAHGVLLQTSAVARGAQGLLVHELYDFISAIEEDDEGLNLTCFEDQVGSVYRLLASTGAMAQEIVWKSQTETSKQMFGHAVSTAASLLGDQRKLHWATDRTGYLESLRMCGISIPD